MKVVVGIVSALMGSMSAQAAPSIAVGAAPKGDATAVASRIIKDNFDSCKRVTSATRRNDGSILATCSGTQYLVFTMYSAKEGKMLELALNCAAAKRLADINC